MGLSVRDGGTTYGGDMKKYQLTEDMAQDRKYWMTKILAVPVQGDGQER